MSNLFQRILASLNRLRLRCGLFRWRNYAWIEPVHPDGGDMTFVASYRPGSLDLIALTATVWVLYYTVHWRHPHELSVYGGGKFDSYRDAIRHICRSVRQGVQL